MTQLNIALDKVYFLWASACFSLLLSPMIITRLSFKMNIKYCEKHLVKTLCFLNLHPKKCVKSRRHNIQWHFQKDITMILMGISTDFPLSINEQPKLAYVKLKFINCSYGKSPFSVSIVIVIVLDSLKNYYFPSLYLVFISQRFLQ